MTELDIFNDLQVEHSRHSQSVQLICQCVRLAQQAGGGIVPLLGPTRSGKKFVLDHVEQELKEQITGPGTLLSNSSFIRGVIPPKPNETDIYTAILTARGYRSHPRERTRDLRRRVFQMIHDEGVTVIALDECSHCAEPGANFSKRSATDHFKVLIETTGIVLILAGLPKFQRLIEENEQFRERAMATIELQPYRWSHDGDRKDFLGATYALIDKIQEAGYTFEVDEEDLVRRLYAASGGRIARVVQLFGYTVALIETSRVLALSDFREMWQTAVQARSGYPNPFATIAPSDLELERSYVLVMQEADLAVPVDNLTTFEASSDEVDG